MTSPAVTAAFEIVEMHYKILEMESEIERLRDIEAKYNALLDSSVKHGEAMMGHLLRATLHGNIRGGQS